MKRLSWRLLCMLVILCGCNNAASGPPGKQSPEASRKPQELRGETGGADDSPEASFALLTQKLEQGHYEAAVRGAKEAYDLTEKSKPIWAWKFRLVQARATLRDLRPNEALRLLNIRPPAGLSVEEFARKDIIAAEAFCKMERNAAGIAALSRARPLLTSPSVDPVLNAEWLFIRGRCEPITSEAARSYYERARKMAQGRDRFLEICSINNLALRLARLERFDEALDYYKPALGLAKEIDSTFLEGGILGYMAQSYYELGEYQKAEQYAVRAEKLAAELGHIEPQARHLIDVGVNEQSRGNLAKAEEYFLRAISLAHKIYDPKEAGSKGVSDDIIARSLNNMTVIELSRQSFDKAEDYNREAALHVRPQSPDDRLTWKLCHIDLALARKDFPAVQLALAQLFAERPQGPILRWSGQERMARMYESMGNLDEAEKWYRTTIRTAVELSAKLNHQEYKTSLLSNLLFFNNYIEFLLRINRPNQALQVAEIGRARALAIKSEHSLPEENTTSWLAGIQGGLKHTGKTVLAYWESETQLYLWVVTASEVKLVHQPYGVRELEKLVAGYQQEIANHRGIEGSFAARKLYEILVQPVAPLIPKDSPVVIVPHRNLYDVNFESLIVPGPEPHYWIEDVRLENAISLSQVIHSTRQRGRYRWNMLAIGAPIQITTEFPALPHAPEEIARVAGFFPAGLKQVYTAEYATPQAFFASNPWTYRYIHFVAHGTKIVLEPLDSAIILSPGTDNAYKLYARDIASLKRPLQAELVTISSCDSAGTRVNDLGGPIGLSWAFLHAGAHQVVAARWKVDDAAMPQLMDRFYSELAKGKTASEALRDAKLDMLRTRGPHQRPFYWATLQLYSRT
ncbi:MAG TPA: CHAT domain-containing tetratricopeptide repeat protein [Candidatus Saccharimonadales bacterium]|jgi:CHAT domain-containing protein|nr:CHAT domain-containing tetratricopeptide repeat protein [Candidatus Saccharimonadales bacterium]